MLHAILIFFIAIFLLQFAVGVCQIVAGLVEVFPEFFKKASYTIGTLIFGAIAFALFDEIAAPFVWIYDHLALSLIVGAWWGVLILAKYKIQNEWHFWGLAILYGLATYGVLELLDLILK